MVKWKANAFHVFICPVQEVPYREPIRFIDVLWASDRLEQRADDNIGIDDCQVE